MKRKILCIRADNMGEILMTEPALRSIRKGYPDAEITLLASSDGSEIASFIPSIDKTIIYNFPWLSGSITNGKELLQLISELKEQKFYRAIIFTTYSQNPLPTALVCYQAGIGSIAGYCRENPYKLMPQWIPDREPYEGIMHEVERQSRLAYFAGGKKVDNRVSISIPTKSSSQNISEKYAVLHPGCSEERSRYSIDGFIAAGKYLSKKGYSIYVTGSKRETKIINAVRKGIGAKAKSFAGALNLEQFISLIDKAEVVVTNNTGPAHIASAVQTPVLVFYAGTNPQHKPWKVPSKVLLFNVDQAKWSKNRVLHHTYPTYKFPSITPKVIHQALQEIIETPSCPLLPVLW